MAPVAGTAKRSGVLTSPITLMSEVRCWARLTMT